MASAAINLLYNVHRHYHCTQIYVCNYAFHTSVARVCSGCNCTPWVEKKFLGVIYRKICKCTHSRVRVNFWTFVAGWGDLEGHSGSFSSFSLCFEGDD